VVVSAAAPLRVLALVHEQGAGPGVFAAAIADRGHQLDQWLLPGGPPPADPLGYDAVFTLGGAVHPDQHDRHGWIAEEERLLRLLLAAGVPLLGLCLGGQLLAAAAGARPRRAARPEIGWSTVELTAEGRDDPLVGPLAPAFTALQWHSYEFPLPPGATALARSEVCLQACRVGERAWALQFHPEVDGAIVNGWIDDHASDQDAVRIGVDPDSFRAETDREVGAFSALGRGLCERWLDLVPAATQTS
jgi:GMP synthase (glutamine-hydrolysing)